MSDTPVIEENVSVESLLDILACPVCLGDLTLLKEQDVLTGLGCRACQKVYPVRDEIPILLPEEAVELAAWREKHTLTPEVL